MPEATNEYDGLTSERYDMRVHRHDDGHIEVQIDGKTSGCPKGSVICAFRRSWDWVGHGETHGPEECFADD